MNEQEAYDTIFPLIAQEVKRSFESPVILLTLKDYANWLFHSLVDIHSALLQPASPEKVITAITHFHHGWLHAVADIENFKHHIRNIPRETIHTKTIEYTIEATKNRHTNFEKHIEKHIYNMSPNMVTVSKIDLGTIADMGQNLESVLLEKQQVLRNLVDPTEYYCRVFDETEELMNWVDNLYNNLAVQLSNVVGVQSPKALRRKLSNTLKEIIDDVAKYLNQDNQSNIDTNKSDNKYIDCRIHTRATDEMIMKDLGEEILQLRRNIDEQRNLQSSSAIAMKHKMLFLEERLQSMENYEQSLNALKKKKTSAEDTGIIFDHLLPLYQRKQLITELIRLWSEALMDKRKDLPIISILSVVDMNKFFYDKMGKFIIDAHGRKLYVNNSDNTYHQLNENNQLVPLGDDDTHVYFYDKYGRYYTNKANTRVYKAYKDASEYQLDIGGRLLFKTQEVINGKTYYYDNIGKFYVDDSGKQIYLGEDGRQYKPDGLGNLLLINDCAQNYNFCPERAPTPEPVEETKYIQRAVGDALKKCIADVILRQPADPVSCLAENLKRYHYKKKERQERKEMEMKLKTERQEERMRDPPEPLTPSQNSVCEEEDNMQEIS